MEFNEYQSQARSTAIYPNIGSNLYYPALGLAGEAGEVCEKIKKIMRDKNGIATPQDIQEIGKELGDQLWYLSNLASEIGLSLNEVAENNIAKLKSRKERGVLQGSGDNR